MSTTSPMFLGDAMTEIDSIAQKIAHAQSVTIKKDELDRCLRDPDYRVRSAAAGNTVLTFSSAVAALKYEIEHARNPCVLSALINNVNVPQFLKDRIKDYLL